MKKTQLLAVILIATMTAQEFATRKIILSDFTSIEVPSMHFNPLLATEDERRRGSLEPFRDNSPLPGGETSEDGAPKDGKRPGQPENVDKPCEFTRVAEHIANAAMANIAFAGPRPVAARIEARTGGAPFLMIVARCGRPRYKRQTAA